MRKTSTRFSLFVRAPFAALAELTGGGDARHLYESANKFGIFPCLLAAGLLGLGISEPLPSWGALLKDLEKHGRNDGHSLVLYQAANKKATEM